MWSEEDTDATVAAKFRPVTYDDPEGSLPYVEIPNRDGGVILVFVYRKDGKLRVSVDLDDADTPVPVPMEICVQGATVFEGK